MQTRGRQSSIENGQMGTRLPNLVTDESSEDGDAFQEPPELPEEGPAVEGQTLAWVEHERGFPSRRAPSFW